MEVVPMMKNVEPLLQEVTKDVKNVHVVIESIVVVTANPVEIENIVVEETEAIEVTEVIDTEREVHEEVKIEVHHQTVPTATQYLCAICPSTLKKVP